MSGPEGDACRPEGGTFTRKAAHTGVIKMSNNAVKFGLWNLILTLGLVGVFFFSLGILAKVTLYHPQGTLFDEMMKIDEEYTIMIGMNNETNTGDFMDIEEAQAIIDEICLDAGCAFSRTVMRGGRVDQEGHRIKGNSLSYTIGLASEQQIQKILKKISSRLNRKSIFVQRKATMHTFYYNKDINNGDYAQ